ncbi:helix-turn-helix domain-containing protein [Persicimonas caeni]|uniref:citrate synthase (unknown stereospecificity) n=1 Tax=Persicimonas caeni TaxID=2292766 RepID=A0A4Y6PNP3_PERCE|nr:citrate synthase family protein [Persicimonas caeni]QDG49425.1 helix-turn-helix domain-containing protein [Persicimonas caeni]QED30646.1 helix-turn-helix domain-containing protein [Persicimonas caeni]
MKLFDSKEAAAYLGVKTSTLYAYVSRGLLDSVQATDDSRRRQYRKADLDRLKQRSDAHAGESAAAAGALRWGAPSLDTAISEITPAGPSYRGRTARGLVREGYAFEQVAELLWTGTLPESPPTWPMADVRPSQRHEEPVADEERPLDRMRLALMHTEMADLARFGTTKEARLECSRRIIMALGAALVSAAPSPRDSHDEESVAARLARHLATPEEAVIRAFDTALIAVADHELNASTFATRVAASTGAGLYPCVAAGLATATGPRHGGACDRGEALIDEVLREGSARKVMLARLRRGEQTPGFGHPLYPHGDPRWKMVVSRLGPTAAPEVLDAVDELVDVADQMRLGPPTVDLALATLCRALGLPSGAAAALFALGRTAGWIAHIFEQQEQGFLLRPRAHYVGVRPLPQ